jgi:hypothetical protein
MSFIVFMQNRTFSSNSSSVAPLGNNFEPIIRIIKWKILTQTAS